VSKNCGSLLNIPPEISRRFRFLLTKLRGLTKWACGLRRRNPIVDYICGYAIFIGKKSFKPLTFIVSQHISSSFRDNRALPLVHPRT
jgi:hypothetical protein